MHRRVLSVDNRRTNVLTLGPDLSKLKKDTLVVLIIPGNPGLGLFYEHFMVHLYNLLEAHFDNNVAVWTISHLGHDLNTIDDLQGANTTLATLPHHQGDEDAYSLHGQVGHKKSFIASFIPDSCPLLLIGHSVGARIILDLMSDTDFVQTKNLKMSYLLFPMVERMHLTPRGPATYIWAHYLPRLATVAVWMIRKLMPEHVLRSIVTKVLRAAHADHSIVNSALQLIHPTVVRNALHLAHSEFACVSSVLDYKFISEHKSKLRFYYGSKDGWAPLDFYRQLVANVPKVRAEVCKRGMIHAFVLRTPEQMAEIVAKWCQEDLQT